MYMTRAGITLVLLAAAAAHAQSLPFYAVPLAGINSSRPLRVYDLENATVDEALVIASLQGLLAQTAPAIYTLPARRNAVNRGQRDWRLFGDGVVRAAYQRWLLSLLEHWSGVVVQYTTTNWTELVIDFQNEITGFAFASPPAANDESLAAALMYCSQARCVVATSAGVAASLLFLGFPMLVDLRGYNITRYFASYPQALPVSNRHCAVLQNPTSFPCLADYAAFSQCPTFYDDIASPNASPAARAILERVAGDSVFIGWGTDELRTVSRLSNMGTGLHAADFAFNLATLSAFRVAPIPPGRLVGPTVAPAPPSARHKVAFVMSDGDNVQWLLGDFLSTNWYGSPERGCTPIAWTISPGLQYLAAPALQGIVDMATGNDTFVSSVSGYSYFYPDQVPQAYLERLSQWSRDAMLAKECMTQNVIGIPITAREAVASLQDTFTLTGNATVLYMPYSGYCHLQGYGEWVHRDGLFLTPRFCLWSPNDYNVTSLAARLNSMPQDAGDSFEGYSVVLVHVWSHTVADVCAVTRLLDPTRVQVVPYYELEAQIRANVRR